MVAADKSRVAIAATVLLGACYVVAVPPKSVPPAIPTTPVMESGPDQPGEPTPALKEELQPKKELQPPVEAKLQAESKPTAESKPPVEVEPKVDIAARGFTRRMNRAKIETRGAPQAKAGFNAFFMQAAAAFDNEAWIGDERRELLAYLRGGAVKKDTAFTRADAGTVAQLQAGSGVEPNGKLQDETMAVLFAMGFRFSARKAMPWEVHLEFYPGELEDLEAWNLEIDEKVTKNGGNYRDVNPPVGEGSLYVRLGRSIVACYRGRGGPPSPLQDVGNHVAGPTQPGAYRLGPAHAHVTSNWYFSQLPWGTEIRRREDGYEYRWPGGRSGWAWATSNSANTLKKPLDNTDFEDLPAVTRDGETFLIWNKNDFGPIAWNLVASDLYVHTSPEAEAEAKAWPLDVEAGTRPPDAAKSLTCSHGCVHIDPLERDEMMKTGYLGADVKLVVRPWDEHLLPNLVRREMLKGTGAAATW